MRRCEPALEEAFYRHSKAVPQIRLYEIAGASWSVEEWCLSLSLVPVPRRSQRERSV